MKLATSLAIAIAIAITGAQTWAASHGHVHPPAGAASAPTAKSMPSKSNPAMAGMDTQMKSMQEMRNKMMAAKTPEERSALMAEHMKTMKEGMAMMSGMSSGGMAGRHQMMEKRMEMMESMMQMMIDRLPAAPATR